MVGFNTDVAGELGLQAFYLAQFPMGPLPPVILGAGLINAVWKSRGTSEGRMSAIVKGWLAGKEAKPLFGQRWDTMWERPLHAIRSELKVA